MTGKNGRQIEEYLLRICKIRQNDFLLGRVIDFHDCNDKAVLNNINCDFLGSCQGRFVALETKQTQSSKGFNKYKLRPKQRLFFQNLIAAQGHGYVLIGFAATIPQIVVIPAYYFWCCSTPSFGTLKYLKQQQFLILDYCREIQNFYNQLQGYLTSQFNDDRHLIKLKLISTIA